MHGNSKQDDKARGESADLAPGDMHDAVDLPVGERNEVSARDKELALVFRDKAFRGEFAARGTSASAGSGNSFMPGFSGETTPFQTKSPSRPGGRTIEPYAPPSLNFKSTATFPLGVGATARIHFSFPGCGSMRTRP